MQLFFQGANYSVTGSRHILKVNGKQILMDCGLFQGQREKETLYNRTLSFDPKGIDCVILSHAHIDHSGNIPNLIKHGYRGLIYATQATRDLCNYMLKDAAYIQEKDVEYLNEKRAKNRLSPIEPIYTLLDAGRALTHFRGTQYEKQFEVTDGVTGIFHDAGHILGSAITELAIHDKQKNIKRTLVYTGDLGRKQLPILRDPYQVTQADYLIIESTYGNRLHESITDAEGKLAKIMNETCARGGKLIIPAFAVERTQEIVYTLNRLFQQKKIPEVSVYVDSPLAVNVTNVFEKHPECLDLEIHQQFLDKHIDPLGFSRLTYIADVEDSKRLNSLNGPFVIISASGMCEFGRILHHLKNNIEDDRTTILVVGYMAKETLGRKLVEGYKSIKIFGQSYAVRARIEVIDAFSAHADRNDLLEYIPAIKGLRKVFLVHGEEGQMRALKDGLTSNGFKDEQIIIPRFGDELELD